MSNSNNFAIYNGFYKVDNLPLENGICRLEWGDGNSYTGQFQNNSINGYGIYKFSDGARYEGFWQNNLKHGLGSLYYPDGSKLQGEFRNDSPNGKCILYSINNNEPFLYIGNFVNGERSGYGKIYNIGELDNKLIYELIYIGQFKKNHFCGQGIYYHDNGNIFYEGNWVDSLPFGNGIIYDINGNLKEIGYYIKGELQTNLNISYVDKLKTKLRNNIFFDFNYIDELDIDQ